LRYLIDCQEDSEGNLYFQEGNGKRSTEDLSDCQMSNKMGSEDLIDCQEESREIPYFQEGKGEQMNSELSSYQQMQQIEREDQRDLLMIGGIGIFLPSSPGEVKVCIVDAATAREKQLDVTIRSIGADTGVFPSSRGR
jgi:hypothetical protein